MLKTNAMRLLAEGRVAFEVHTYDIEQGVDAMAVARFLNRPPEQMFKTLVTEAAPHTYFVFVVPANSVLNLKKAAKVAGVKNLNMLPQKMLLPVTGYIHGGCSPVGMKKSFPTFIDETAVLFDHIFLSGGKLGLTLELNAEELASFIGAHFADLT